MIQPLINLIVGLILLLFLVLLFLPKFGLISFIRKSQIDSRKILLEDALKFFFESQQENLPVSKNSLKKYLKLKDESLDRLMQQLKNMNLINIHGEQSSLTEDGNSYALRVIRTHRIWEKYLAEETSIKEHDWHSEAETKEHLLTDNELEIINQKIGNPLYDPHGDPIPLKDGTLPPFTGNTLLQLKLNDIAKVIHLEDEPKEIFKKIIALNISVGSIIKLINLEDDKIGIELNGSKILLTKDIAKNITVKKVDASINENAELIRLTDLKKGERATVVSISKSCRGQQRRRLLDFGIVPGSKISTEIESLGKDPRGYKVRGTIVALRNKTANQILIKKEIL